jgi:hypothetical protein
MNSMMKNKMEKDVLRSSFSNRKRTLSINNSDHINKQVIVRIIDDRINRIY